MEEIFNRVKNNPLFNDINFVDFSMMMNCMCARIKKYKKNEFIIISGDKISFMGLILSGSAQVLKDGKDGNTTILKDIKNGELFAEVFACAQTFKSPVTVKVKEDCEILIFDYNKILTNDNSKYHFKLIKNILKIVAQKALMLNEKIEIMSKRTTREKLIAFFDANRNGKNNFTINYNREELAQYLCVDRSAMSNEISKMKNDNLILVNKNNITVLY